MKNFKLKYFIGLVMGISTLLYLLMLYITLVTSSTFWKYLKPLSVVVAIDALFVVVFYHWAWQWKIWHPWLVPAPNLNGTWTGEIRSNWINPNTRQKLPPIPAQLTIKQTLFTIHCTMKTQEMTSDSFTADIATTKLVYSYKSYPKSEANHRSHPHFGTMIFDFTNEGSKRLEGDYWTSRETTGQCNFIFSDKRKRYVFPTPGKHPTKESEGQGKQSDTGNVTNQGNIGIQINYSKTNRDLNARNTENGGEETE